MIDPPRSSLGLKNEVAHTGHTHSFYGVRFLGVCNGGVVFVFGRKRAQFIITFL
jgi:hypothetical protein